MTRFTAAGTGDALTRCLYMAHPHHTDPEDQTPRERDLERRSNAPAVSPWLFIGLIALLGVVVYVVSAIAGSQPPAT